MSKKEELIHLTLKQLSESLKTSPDNFKLEDPSTGSVTGNFPGPTIVWQFKVQIEENKFIQDPLNAVKTIIVTYNKIGRQLQCFIYNREVNNYNYSSTAEAQATITYHEHVPLIFYRTYREFMGLRKALLKNKTEKEYVNYMKRLNGIFPATHEDELFK